MRSRMAARSRRCRATGKIGVPRHRLDLFHL
jgi:hypothetical protein